MNKLNLKMANQFNLPLIVDDIQGYVAAQKDGTPILETFNAGKDLDYIIHAVNNHDANIETIDRLTLSFVNLRTSLHMILKRKEFSDFDIDECCKATLELTSEAKYFSKLIKDAEQHIKEGSTLSLTEIFESLGLNEGK